VQGLLAAGVQYLAAGSNGHHDNDGNDDDDAEELLLFFEAMCCGACNGGQLVHVVHEEAPADAEKVPLGHSVHLEYMDESLASPLAPPPLELKDPAGHSWHSTSCVSLPAKDMNCPGEHFEYGAHTASVPLM
jgi:hypothetical protein